MSKKNFLLLSLDDDKTKKIANVVNNDTSKKILEYLAEKDGTETQIANDLNLPISSVHYNIQQLIETKLIDWKNYHYSEKGKEVRHYSLANKYIIIAPKEDKASILEQIKKIIPGFVITLLGAGLIESYYRMQNVGKSVTLSMAESSGRVMESMAESDKVLIQESSQKVVESSSPLLHDPTIFFIIGCFLVLIITFLFLTKKEFK